MPVVAHGPMICPAPVAVAPVTLITLVVALGAVVGLEKVAVAAPLWVRPARVSVWALVGVPAPAMFVFSTTLNTPLLRATAPMVSAKVTPTVEVLA